MQTTGYFPKKFRSAELNGLTSDEQGMPIVEVTPFSWRVETWDVVPGWYGGAPLALLVDGLESHRSKPNWLMRQIMNCSAVAVAASLAFATG